MKIISIANQIGGVGKKVLLIDLDPQGNLTKYLKHTYKDD